jgi:septal ring factor EnvC (AmiA/AmiB activator)
MNESATSSQRMKVLEQDLRQTLETVERLQEEKKNFSKIKRQHNVAQRELEQLQRTIVDDKHRIDNGMK